MGDIANLPAPVGGQLAAMPAPNTGAPVDSNEVASPMQSGFRSGMNSLGASLNALVGQTGETLGLQEFANDRFKDAQNYADAANTPGIKNWGEVKDFTTLTHFVGNLIGSSTAQTLPAMGLAVGLRRPIAGVMAGMAPVEAGSQVQTLRQDPVAMAKGPGAVLANAVGTGVVNAGIDATFGGEGQMARRALGQATKEGIGKAVVKGAVGEGITEPVQNLVGQGMHQQLNPDKQIDTSQLKEEAIGGAIMGGVFGGVGHAAGAAPRALQSVAQSAGELKDRFKRPAPPADAEVDLPPDSVDSPERIAEWLKTHEEAATEYLKGKWDSVKEQGAWQTADEFVRDPAARQAAAQNLKDGWQESKVKPVLEGVLKYGKDLGERIQKRRETKYSKMENRPDFNEMQKDVLAGHPIYVGGQTPEVGAFMAKNGYKMTAEGKWEPAAKRSEMRGKMDTMVLQAIAKVLPEDFKSQIPADKVEEIADIFRRLAANPEEFTESGVPRTFEKLLGRDVFRDTIKNVSHMIGADVDPAVKAFKAKEATDGNQLEQIKAVINTHARAEYRMREDQHKVLMDEVAPRILEKLNDHDGFKVAEINTDPEFHQDMQETFGANVDAAYKALEKIKPDETTVNEAFDTSDTPSADARLDRSFNDTPDGNESLKKLKEELEAEYGRRNVRVTDYEVEPGKRALKMENADTVGLDDEAWSRVREDPKYNRSGFENGILTVHTAKGTENKINLMRLTAEMMRGEPSNEQGVRYVRDMFNRGMTALLNSDNFKDVKGLRKDNGTWDIPGNTPVARFNGRVYTYARLKAASFDPSPAALKLRQAVRDAKGSPRARKAAIHDLNEFFDKKSKDTKDVAAAEEDAMAELQDQGPDFFEEAAAPLKQALEDAKQAKDGRRRELYLDAALERLEREAERLRKDEPTIDNPESMPAQAEGVRTHEEDLGAGATGIGGTTAPAFAEPTMKTAVGTKEETVTHTKSTADKLVDQLAKDMEKKRMSSQPDYRAKPNDKKFNTMNVGDGPASEAERQAVRDYIKKVLGDKVAVDFIDKLSNAGEATMIGGEEMIKISAMAADPTSVGYHEALHIMFKRMIKANPKAAHTLLRAASAPAIVARLRTLLKGHTEALKQLSDPEERLAYMYQFAASGHKGLINIGPETRTWFDKVKGVLRKIAAVWADDFATAEAVEKAGDILAAFHEGAFANKNTVAQVLHDKFPRGAYEAAEHMLPWASKLANKFLWTATGAVRDANIPAMTEIMDKFYTSVESQDQTPGFLQEKHVAYNRFINRIADVFPKTKEREKIVWDDLHTGKPAQTAEGKVIRQVLSDVHQYLVDKEVQLITKGKNGKLEYHELGKIENYFPRVYDQEYLRSEEGKEAFLKLMEKHNVPADRAADTYATVTRYVETGKPGEEDTAIGLTYFTPALAKRTLGFVPDAELAPFMSQDLFGTLSQYLQRATRRGEYAVRFGNVGEDIHGATEIAIKQGATAIQLKAFADSVQAMEGTLGADIDPKLKNLYSGLMTYQNLRLLPLQLFSSLIDPLGLMVRGASMGEAFTAFAKGLQDLATLGKTSKDAAFELAKTMGSIDAANAHGLMSEMAGSAYMPKLQRAINDKFFRWNGMELWNNRMRSQATVAAQNFIDKHMNRPTEHSERFLAELNLTKGEALDASNPNYVRAVNKWVDEAILRPNAALRPAYMSDPNWMLISHLKQYTYLFQKVVVARVYHELQHNNYSPAYALAAYVPGMMAADMLKMLLTPGSGDDNARAGWTLMDWFGHGLQRAGLFGPSQYGLEMGTDMKRGGIGIESMAGPTIQQALQFAQGSMQGHMGLQIEKAIPGYSLIKPAGNSGGK